MQIFRVLGANICARRLGLILFIFFSDSNLDRTEKERKKSKGIKKYINLKKKAVYSRRILRVSTMKSSQAQLQIRDVTR